MQPALPPAETNHDREQRVTQDPRSLPPEDLLAVILGTTPEAVLEVFRQLQAQSLLDLLTSGASLHKTDLSSESKNRLRAALELASRIVGVQVARVDLGLEHGRSVQKFLRLHCRLSHTESTRLGILTLAYRRWCEGVGAKPSSSRVLEDLLRRMGAAEYPKGEWGIELLTQGLAQGAGAS